MFRINSHAVGRFLPLTVDAIKVAGITGLSAAQVTALTTPFEPGQSLAAVATLQTFTVTCTADADAPANRYLEVYVWVLGKPLVYAAISYNPVPTPIKSRLWRLGPEVHGGAGAGLSVVCTLPSAAPVARLQIIPRGVFIRTVAEPPEPVYPD